MLKELKEFGLTDNEIKVYLGLVELGNSSVTAIRNKADIHTSRVYEALNSLVEKGLASYHLKNNTKIFVAQDPDVMFDILDEKRENLLKIMPEIKILQTKEQEEYRVSLFEGSKAITQLYDHTLFKMGEKDEILVLGAGKEIEHNLARTYFKQFTDRRIKKGVKMRMIFNEDASKTAKSFNSRELTEARVLPKGQKVPTPMNIWDGKVTTLLLEKKPVAFQMESTAVESSYKTYFEFLWENATKLK